MHQCTPKCPAPALVLALLALHFQATALDFSITEPPKPVSDAEISVRDATVRLPPGQWTYVAHVKTESSDPGMNTSIPVHTGYFAELSEGKFRAGVVLMLPEARLVTTRWSSDICEAEGTLYKDGFDGSVREPECLVVHRRNSHLTARTSAFYVQAQEWMKLNGMAPIGPVYEIVYSRYSLTGHGLIRAFVPINTFATREAAVEWAKQLRTHLKTFIERRSSRAELPPLP